jgi:hypothetical protein
MSGLIYLARPWSGLLQSDYHDGHIKYPARAFVTQEDAERYATENFPLTLNPLANCYSEDFSIEDDGIEGELIIFLNTENSDEATDRTVSIKDLLAQIAALGLPPPNLSSEDVILEETLPEWWEANAPAMSDEQKRVMWRFLVPEPYQIIPVELEIEE